MPRKKKNRKHTKDILNHDKLDIKQYSKAMIILLISTLYTNSVLAEELHFVINGKSFHSNERPNNKYNERNFGIGAQFDFNNFDKNIVPFLNIGGFSDSNNNPSFYIGGGITHRTNFRNSWKSFHIDAGASAFLMSRVYPATSGEESSSLIPGILPMISIGTESTALNIVYIPDVSVNKASLWFIQLKLKTDIL